MQLCGAGTAASRRAQASTRPAASGWPPAKVLPACREDTCACQDARVSKMDSCYKREPVVRKSLTPLEKSRGPDPTRTYWASEPDKDVARSLGLWNRAPHLLPSQNPAVITTSSENPCQYLVLDHGIIGSIENSLRSPSTHILDQCWWIACKHFSAVRVP